MRKSEIGIKAPAEVENEFSKEVFEGLRSSPKFLKSKYFYDKKGDELFQQIMKLPEYYLTRSEFEILNQNKEKILRILKPKEHLELIDLGAGDVYKTKILLKYFQDQRVDFTYIPVDISKNAIEKITTDLRSDIPGLVVNGICAEYLSAIKVLKKNSRKIIVFLGASIGNFSIKETMDFLKETSEKMTPQDLLVIGFDLKKDPDVILAAYNDKAGVSRQFNLNLLQRINREMGANFDLELFDHSPYYHPESGEIRSLLISKTSQTVKIPALDLSVNLDEGEPIHTEVSKKYSLKEIAALADTSGFEVVENLLDSKKYFADSLWRIKQT
ncbi:MAG: L-histidine N(alpha)-methyltransferase [Anditalea sp.]